jgi:hypothetical protein
MAEAMSEAREVASGAAKRSAATSTAVSLRGEIMVYSAVEVNLCLTGGIGVLILK